MQTVSEEKTIVGTMNAGGYYQFITPGFPRSEGTFEGWTDFGWMVFTDNDGETRFWNPANLSNIRPETIRMAR